MQILERHGSAVWDWCEVQYMVKFDSGTRIYFKNQKDSLFVECDLQQLFHMWYNRSGAN